MPSTGSIASTRRATSARRSRSQAQMMPWERFSNCATARLMACGSPGLVGAAQRHLADSRGLYSPDVQAHVDDLDVVGEVTRRDDVDAGPGDLDDRVLADAARGLHQRAPVDELHRRCHVL